MEVIKEIVIGLLNKNEAGIIRTNYINYNGKKTQLGDSLRLVYDNSIQDRERIREELEEPYLSAVLSVWGEEPTVDLEEESEEGNNEE